jgi:GGDEF domain-containing protein
VLNEAQPDADSMGMSSNAHTVAAATAAPATSADVATLLPSRAALLERLDERLPLTVRTSATLMVIGLLRGDDGWPTAQGALAAVTKLLASSLRGDDFLAKSGPGEFVVLMSGPVDAAEPAAERLVTAIGELGIEGLTAAAGLTPLAPELTATEVLRRGLVSLTCGRRAGAGTVIRYREPY